MSAKPYVTAARYAALLGVSVEAVVEDIQRGCRSGTADAFAITGDRQGDFWLVEGWETSDERLAVHRARLATADSASAVQEEGA